MEILMEKKKKTNRIKNIIEIIHSNFYNFEIYPTIFYSTKIFLKSNALER